MLARPNCKSYCYFIRRNRISRTTIFVPYKYGCYSFQAAADISTMQKYGQVRVSNKGIEKADPIDYVSLLKEKDRMALKQLHLLHGGKDYKDLIHFFN
jgi:hypothetical protein